MKAVVVEPGEGHRVGNIEFLARSAGELTFGVGDEEVVAGPGTFVLVPPQVEHTFANRGEVVARFVNVHAPAGFDLRMEAD